MIDLEAHRKRLDTVKSYPELNYEWRRARDEAANKLYSDADELIRLAGIGKEHEFCGMDEVDAEIEKSGRRLRERLSKGHGKK